MVDKLKKYLSNSNHKSIKYKRHNHSNKELYGEVNEVPAVFSYCTSLKFYKEVPPQHLEKSLVDWIENLRLWAVQNKYFIGHIKAFVEGGEDFKLWISTTGKVINVKGSEVKEPSSLKFITINMTAIIFGIDEKDLKLIVLELLQKSTAKYNK